VPSRGAQWKPAYTESGIVTGNREFDLVVWGATGFTGRLVAEYLAANEGVGQRLRWAIAGRSAAKLGEVARDIAQQVSGFEPSALPRLVADSTDLHSMRGLAARTRVVISTVGPYARYGTPLVQACAELGTDYCDLAGEVQWIHRMIADWDAPARASGARIVHCCGFDSIPFDLGAWYLQRGMHARHGVYAPRVHTVVRSMRGNFSGGTFASMLGFVQEAVANPAVRRLAVDANALMPPAPGTPFLPLPDRVSFCGPLGVWTGPFVMAAVNTKIVRRSNALLGLPWGANFQYSEAMATGKGLSGRVRAHALQAGLAAFTGSLALPPTRALVRSLLPAPGEGPDRAARDNGYYRIEVVGWHPQFGHPATVATVSGEGDPGYASTSRMLAEAGLCLALDKVPSTGGSWTPAACMAAPLLARLEKRARLVFELREIAPSGG
jgi:short subunit dehydrogenase-like uncharacterized protein